MSDSTVVLRSALTTLPTYVPGRTVAGAVKLASNESTAPMLPEVLARITAAAAQANRYPDASSSALVDALAAKFGVDPAQVAVGCGSVALCQQAIQTVADDGDEVLYPWRSFEAYPILTAVAGGQAVQVPLGDGQRFDLDALAAAVTARTRAIFLCTPNNPTGTALGRAEVAAFLERVPPRVLVVLDEAYREYVSDPSVVDGLTMLRYPNVVVMRSFSKAYGLAGLRVGYAIAADPAVAMALRRVGLPFAVSRVAQAAALASLEPTVEGQLFARVAEVVAQRSRVHAELVRLGYPATPSQANFVWLPLGEHTTDWARGCEAHGVIVRPFAGNGARVTVSDAADNDRFLSAAAALA